MVDVSTYDRNLSSASDLGLSAALRQLLFRWEADASLFESEHLLERLALLDELDVIGCGETFPASLDPEIANPLQALRFRLEAANEALFRCARLEIASQGNSSVLRRWLTEPGDRQDSRGPRSPRPTHPTRPGLGFDRRDEIVSGILRLGEPYEMELPLTLEMTPYQPTPARHILDLIEACELSAGDVLVDLGSGLGHVPLLVSILTGSCTLGIELQPAYVAIAREAARNLNLSHARFMAEDARTAEIATGTVFYLFTPFTGSLLMDVLDSLRQESRCRRIRICSLGPCTRNLREQRWLRATRLPETERIAVFESR